MRRAGGAGVRASSGPLAARKPVILWEPSQNGFCAERPHRHSATVPLPGEMRSPSWVTSSNGPRINSGPSSHGVTVTDSFPLCRICPNCPQRGGTNRSRPGAPVGRRVDVSAGVGGREHAAPVRVDLDAAIGLVTLGKRIGIRSE